MKVVINTCFGGYSLSPVATEALAKRKGIEKVYWATSRYEGGGFRYHEATADEMRHGVFLVPFSTPSFEAESALYDLVRPEPRSDADLVAVVEELGVEAASGAHAMLKIVEVDDGVEWSVEEYDGREWVAEAHRTWA